jgi:hypothetical protein
MIAVVGMAAAALLTSGNPGTLSATLSIADVFLFLVVFAVFAFFARLAIVRSSLRPVFYGRSVPARVALVCG